MHSENLLKLYFCPSVFAQTYRSYGLATLRYPVLEITATVEPFENGRAFSLRVIQAGKPDTRR